MNNLTTFYVIRHGETESNVKKIIQGQLDSPLTKKGIEEIKHIAKKLKGIKFDYAFSSDLLRAKRTAEIIALEHKLEVQTTKLLRERRFGKFEGKPEIDFASVAETRRKLAAEQRYSHKIHGIESDKEIVERFVTFMREVAIAKPGKKILAVTHGGLIRFFLIKLGVGDHNTLRAGTVKNGAFVKIETDGIDFFVKEMSGVQFVN